jgi:CheY-like chemotaxis protein
MHTARLLLVDDDRDNLEVLTVILGETYRVWDGRECLEAIRARPGYGRVPAIALTAFAHDVDRKAFLAAGLEAVVRKPVLDHRGLLAVIDSLLTSAGSWRGQSVSVDVLTVPANGGKIAVDGFGQLSTSGHA